MAGSIPLFIIAERNQKKRRRAYAFIQLERTLVLLAAAVRYESYPPVVFKLD
jgi:hypothetical protein